MKRIKKMKEKDIRLALLFCMFTALAADILCVLFLLGILQSRWILNVIQCTCDPAAYSTDPLRVCTETDGGCMGEPAVADWLYRKLPLLQFRMVKESDFVIKRCWSEVDCEYPFDGYARKKGRKR